MTSGVLDGMKGTRYTGGTPASVGWTPLDTGTSPLHNPLSLNLQTRRRQTYDRHLLPVDLSEGPDPSTSLVSSRSRVFRRPVSVVVDGSV